MSMFSEDETIVEDDSEVSKPEYEEITYKRKKKKGQQKEALENLPEEIIEYRLPEEEQIW